MAVGRLVVLAAFLATTDALVTARARCPRAGTVQLGFFDWLTAPAPPYEDDDDLSPNAAAAFEAICRPDGWLVKCEIGSNIARSVGGSGELAKGSSSTAAIEFLMSFSRDRGYVPPQGPVTLLRQSRFLNTQRPGFWKLESDDDDGVPKTIQWRLQTAEEGLQLGGDVLVPPGPLFFNARCAWNSATKQVTLSDGRLTVKEDIGINTGLFQARGILAEFKIVGTFECKAAVSST